MPRRGNVPKRRIAPEALYGSVLLHKFINKIMYDGKKSTAEKIVYTAIAEAAKRLKKDNPLEVFTKALENVTPMVEVKARRVGGATYQVPIEVSRARGQSIGMQWLKTVCLDRGGKSMAENLAIEIVDAFNGAGSALKKREDLHKTADANRAFAHFKW